MKDDVTFLTKTSFSNRTRRDTLRYLKTTKQVKSPHCNRLILIYDSSSLNAHFTDDCVLFRQFWYSALATRFGGHVCGNHKKSSVENKRSIWEQSFSCLFKFSSRLFALSFPTWSLLHHSFSHTILLLCRLFKSQNFIIIASSCTYSHFRLVVLIHPLDAFRYEYIT